jgi:hypothetical protein
LVWQVVDASGRPLYTDNHGDGFDDEDDDDVSSAA